MRLLQLISETRRVAADRGESEEAIRELARQQSAVLQIFGGLALRVQESLYRLDDLGSLDHEPLEKLDVRAKRYLDASLA